MADRTWKAFERRMARLFGTSRIPAAGWGEGAQTDAPDFETVGFAFQAKKGYAPPAYLTAWLDGVRAVAAKRGRTGVVVWGGKGVKDADALVFLRAEDFRRLVAKLDASPSASPSRTPSGSTSA